MIKFKTIFALLFLLLISININNVFAGEEKCSIEQTPEIIEKYLETLHETVEQINSLVEERYKPSLIGGIFPKTTKSITDIKEIYGNLNKIFDWIGYEIDITYTIQENISEIPRQVKRDIKLLEKEEKYIRLANPSGASVEISGQEICESKQYCELDFTKNYKAIDLIVILKQSTNKIKNIIKNQASDYNFKDNKQVLFVTEDDIKEIYSKENIMNCSLAESIDGEKGFFATIKEKIENINLLQEESEDGMKDWKESIALMFGTSTNQKEVEKRVLAQELARQGIGGNYADAIKQNLEGFNNSDPGEFPFLQGEAGFFNSLQIQLNEFEEALEKNFPGYKKGVLNDKSIGLKQIPEDIKKLKIIKYNQINIQSEYQRLKSLGLPENIETDKLVFQIIDIHINISQMINTLKRICPLSVKVCNDQKRGMGLCGECN